MAYLECFGSQTEVWALFKEDYYYEDYWSETKLYKCEAKINVLEVFIVMKNS